MKNYFELTGCSESRESPYAADFKKAIILLDHIIEFDLTKDDFYDDADEIRQTILTLSVVTKFGRLRFENIEMSEYERFEQAFKNWLDEKDQPARIREL